MSLSRLAEGDNRFETGCFEPSKEKQMNRIPGVVMFLFLSLFFTTGFGFFAAKKEEPKKDTSEAQTETVAVQEQTVTQETEQKEETVAEEKEEGVMDITPEGPDARSDEKRKQLTDDEAKALKKKVEKIQRDIQMVRDVQTAMDTRTTVNSLAGISATGSAAKTPVVPAAGAAVPPGVSNPGVGVPSGGLAPGTRGAIDTAQRVQDLQLTLDKIKSEQERIRREQERIAEEKRRLEQQAQATQAR
jgi:hypothetical protein